MKKYITYIGLSLFVLILIGTLVMGLKDLIGNSIKEVNVNLNPELEKYRSEIIPEECRLPDYKEEAESWKEHLGHHQETLYCLDYYNELEGGN